MANKLSDETQPVKQAFADAVIGGDVPACRELLARHPELLHTTRWGSSSLLQLAATSKCIPMVEFLISSGLDPHEINAGRNVLSEAVGSGDLEMARWLLAQGVAVLASTGLSGGTLFDAVVSGSADMIDLLVKHGADVNCLFGSPPMSPLSLALRLGKSDIAEALRRLGARMPPYSTPVSGQDHRQAVVDHISSTVGPVSTVALCSVVPAVIPLSLHLAPPGPGRNFLTLFTAGMSSQPLPNTDGWDDFRFVELLMRLPATWPTSWEELLSPAYSWALTSLRWIALATFEAGMSFCGQAVFPYHFPPERISPEVPFDSFLLLSVTAPRDRLRTSVGKQVLIYRVLPLHPQERLFLETHDFPAFLGLTPNHSFPGIVDPHRPSFVS